MPRSRIRVTGLDRWIGILESFDEPTAEQERMWRQATEVMFDRSQQYVHRDTAALQASGRYAAHRERRAVVGEVTYGNTQVDYALFEAKRGGSHDYFARAFVATTRVFKATLGDMLEARWK